MPRIVISYRRSDSASATGRISEKLVSRFGDAAVFTDIDNIPLGIDYRTYVHDIIAGSDVVLVVVGSRWLDERNAERLKDPDDPVHFEIQTALQLGVPIIPVLVDDASMPSFSALPEPLKSFHYRNAAIVEPGRDFRVHMERLTRSIEKLLEKREHASPVAEVAPKPGPAEERAADPPAPKADVLRPDAEEALFSAVRAALDADEARSSEPEPPAPTTPDRSTDLAEFPDFQPVHSRQDRRPIELDPPLLVDGVTPRPVDRRRVIPRIGRWPMVLGLFLLAVAGAIVVYRPSGSDAVMPPVIIADQTSVPKTATPSPLPTPPSATPAPAPAAAQPQAIEPKRVRTQTIRTDPPQTVPLIDKTAPAGGYVVQVSAQKTEAEALSSYRALQAKYPTVLGGREPTIRRADLGDKGAYYRAQVGPFAGAGDANAFCDNLKAAGGQCIVQKN
jgi:hypothetical protein